jgi:hypothetical protein
MRLLDYLRYWREYFWFRNRTSQRMEIMPRLGDCTKSISFDRHYIYHPAWAIRKIVDINPKKHIDISSILYFSTMLSSIVPVEFYDYRPAKVKLNNLKTGSVDLLNLPFKSGSITSLSCMHTVEHIGLGRYGDKLDVDGDIRAIDELIRVMAPGGSLLFVVPVGRPRIVFNAHRVYEHKKIMKIFKEFSLMEMMMVPDDDVDEGYYVNPLEKIIDIQDYACGCYWFVKNK